MLVQDGVTDGGEGGQNDYSLAPAGQKKRYFKLVKHDLEYIRPAESGRRDAAGIQLCFSVR